MRDAWEPIKAAVLAGDAQRVADLSLTLDEDAREATFTEAWALYGTLATQEHGAVWQAVATAVFAVAPPHLAGVAVPDRVEQLVRARPLEWRDQWLRGGWGLGGASKWRTYRSLVRSGDCTPLSPVAGSHLMLQALDDQTVDPVSLVLAEPGVLDEEIWAPFAIGNLWYSGYERWEGTVLELADTGTLSRDRFLDELLAFIARVEDRYENAHVHLVRFHDLQVVPTVDEIAARRDVYLGLLEHEIGRVAGMAAGALTRLDRVRPLDGRALLPDVRANAEVERIVALVVRVLDREPALRGWLTEMLAHPSAAARETAQEALEGWDTRAAWEAIESAAEAGEFERVADLCLALTEADRARLSARSVALKERLQWGDWTKPVPRAGQTARFGLGPPIPEDERYHEPPYSHLERLVRSRPREWRDAWARLVLRGGHWDFVVTWRTLRTLIRDGSCTAGDDTALMLRALDASERPADELRAFPEVLEERVWAPFALERVSWETPWAGWERGLIELSADGSIARDRLLDETVAALLHHTDAGTLKALIAFHDKQLKPSPAELAARVDRYLQLLESGRDSTVGFALALFVRLDRAHPVDGRELLDRLAPAVGLRSKTHAKRAVLLIGSALDREPTLEGTELLLDALGHPAAEVQAQALTVLERHPADPAGLTAAVDLVDPGLRSRISALAGAVPAPVSSTAAAVAPAGPEPITPVAGVDELLDLASRLLEGLEDPDEFERFVDGLSRLADAPVPKGRCTALLRRARRDQYRWDRHVRFLCIQWLDDVTFAAGGGTPISARLAVVMRRLKARSPAILLSAPTHRGGFLSADVLRERLQAGGPIEDDDLALALLRVPPAEAPTFTTGWKPVTAAEVFGGHDPRGYHSLLFYRVLGLHWPTQREHYYALPFLERNQPSWLNATLTTMLYPGEPLGGYAAYLIALALHEADANRLLAADVLADALPARRIEAVTLGNTLARVTAERKPARLAASLEHVAIPELQPVLEAMFAALELRSPQLIGAIDLLRRLAQETGTRVSDPGARAYLESLTAKSGKLAGAALAV